MTRPVLWVMMWGAILIILMIDDCFWGGIGNWWVFSIKLKIFRPICDLWIDLWWIIISNLFYDVLIEEVEKQENQNWIGWSKSYACGRWLWFDGFGDWKKLNLFTRNAQSFQIITWKSHLRKVHGIADPQVEEIISWC